MGYACYFQRKYHEGLSATLGKIRGNVPVFTKHGYSVSVVQAGHHHTQQIALQMVEKGIIDYIPFTQTFHPYNHTVKSIIFKNFKLIQNDSEISTIFLQSPPISFKHHNNILSNFFYFTLMTNEEL